MTDHFTERTLVLIKPDGVMRGLVGEIIRRIEQRGLKVVGIKMVRPVASMARSHYDGDERWVRGLGQNSLRSYRELGQDPKAALATDDELQIGQKVRGWLEDYLTFGPLIAIVIEGLHAIKLVRKLTGHAIPHLAEPGTIRGDLAHDSPTRANLDKRATANLVHASGNQAEAEKEIRLWFSEAEIFEVDRPDEAAMFLRRKKD